LAFIIQHSILLTKSIPRYFARHVNAWLASLGGELSLSSSRNNNFQVHLKLKNHFDLCRLLKQGNFAIDPHY